MLVELWYTNNVRCVGGVMGHKYCALCKGLVLCAAAGGAHKTGVSFEVKFIHFFLYP